MASGWSRTYRRVASSGFRVSSSQPRITRNSEPANSERRRGSMAEREGMLRREATARGNAIPKADLALDARGRRWEDLAAEIDAAMSRLEIGGVLAVESDDPQAPEAVVGWGRSTGNELV